jgi:hypothetical protein
MVMNLNIIIHAKQHTPPSWSNKLNKERMRQHPTCSSLKRKKLAVASS